MVFPPWPVVVEVPVLLGPLASGSFAGADKEDDNAMTVVIHFESPEGLKGFGGDAELTQARIDSGVIMDQSKMTMMTDESVMNHKG